jgi:ankyrin repeat protein
MPAIDPRNVRWKKAAGEEMQFSTKFLTAIIFVALVCSPGCGQQNKKSEKGSCECIDKSESHAVPVDQSWCKKVDPTDTNYSQNDRLIRACIRGDVGIVKRLVSQGAGISYCDAYGRTPLMYAVKFGHTDVAEFLCSAGADVNAGRSIIYYRSFFKFSSLDIIAGTALSEAALNGDVAMGRMLLARSAEVNKSNGIGKTALFYAAREGRTEFVKFLLDNKATGYIAKNYADETALNFAIRGGHSDIVNMLFHARQKVDINTMISALGAAVKANNPEMVCILRKAGGRLFYTWHDNEYRHYSPLTHACELGSLEIAKLLICNDKKAALELDAGSRKEALLAAARTGKMELVKLLLDHGVNVEDYVIENVIYDELFWKCNPEIICFLLDLIVDRLPGKSLKGKTWKTYENINITDLCTGKGTTLIPDTSGLTRLMIDAAFGRIEAMKKDIGEDNPRNMFREININQTAKGGVTALSYAISAGQLEAVRLLVQNGADINTPIRVLNGYARTPLENAYYYGKLEIARYLARQGAEISRKSIHGSLGSSLKDFAPFGRTSSESSDLWNACEWSGKWFRYVLPLFLMAALSNDSTLFFTIANRNDPDITAEDYQAAFLIASSKGHARIAEFLLKKDPSLLTPPKDQSDNLGTVTVDGASLLMAARNGHIAIVKLLLGKPFPKKFWAKYLPMSFVAAEYTGDKEIADLLLQRAY